MIPPKHHGSLRSFGWWHKHLAGKQTKTHLTAQPTPPPLPKKMIIRTNTEPLSKDTQSPWKLLPQSPLIHLRCRPQLGCQCWLLGQLWTQGLDAESYELLGDLCTGGVCPQQQTVSPQLTTLSIKDSFNSTSPIQPAEVPPSSEQGRGIQKPQRQALARGLENAWVIGQIETFIQLHEN